MTDVPPTDRSNSNPPDPKTPSRDPVAIAVACVALAVFIGFIIYMFSWLDEQEPQWSRAVYLLSGVEAIAFAAAGFLFGREVNRGRAENAEKRAKHAEEKAVEKQQDVNNLATAVVESFTGVGGEPGVQGDLQRGTPAAPTSRALTLALDVLRRSR